MLTSTYSHGTIRTIKWKRSALGRGG